MQTSWTTLPFRFRTMADYEVKLNDMIGGLFYDLLPAAGFDVREEQIYTAFRIAKAMVAGKVLLAEAGLGTGKTLAYLGAAVCHARLRGAPVVIASASGVLQEQLVDPQGDLAVLARVLNLKVDARLAKHPSEYICEVKVDELDRSGKRRKGQARLLKWSGESQLGNRAEVPDVPDDLWQRVAWDDSMPCDTCPRRGYCRLTRAREHYRVASDLIICDHDLFFRDLWTRRERRELGLTQLLPTYSGVVLDEGHDVPEVAQRAAGAMLRRDTLQEGLNDSTGHSDRVSLVRAADQTERALKAFWAQIEAAVIPAALQRLHIRRDEALISAAERLTSALDDLQDELATEEAMHEETDFDVLLRAIQARFDQALRALEMLQLPSEETVAWAVKGRDGGHDVWTVPRRLDSLLKKELYSQRVPVVFSSATLASGDSFDYFQRVVGAPDALTAGVGTPFDLEEQALVYLPEGPTADLQPVEQLVQVLQATQGRALVLLDSLPALAELRLALTGRELPWPLLWEGDGERADLVRRFAAEPRSVLLGLSYWEGIDVPGEALSAVVVLRLPFPPHDPVMIARREDAKAAGLDPFAAVDVPAMAVRLKQGRGRLIRASTDRGVLALLDTTFLGTAYEAAVRGALPEGAPETGDLEKVRDFLKTPPLSESRKSSEPQL